MGYYFKKALLPFVYLIFMMMLSFAVYSVKSVAIRYVLVSAILIIYVFIVGGVSYKEGQQALKTRISNDIERRIIVETGEDRLLNTKEEYKPYKGFLVGFTACIPLLVLLLIHALLIPSASGTSTFAGTVAGIIYIVVYNFFRVSSIPITLYTPFYSLLAVPVLMLVTGIPYIMGAKSIERTQKEIKDIHKQIYGE